MHYPNYFVPVFAVQLTFLCLTVTYGKNVAEKEIVCLYNTESYFKHNFTPSMIDATLCNLCNYEFAILDPSTYCITSRNPELDLEMNFFKEATNLKQNNTQLKVLISLGGWDDSTEKYSKLAEDPKKRANFIKTLIPFLKKYGFDGLDFAWEYPNCWKGDCGIHWRDRINYVTLLKEISESFSKNSMILSASVSAVKSEIDHSYRPEFHKYLNHINLLAFDLHGSWESKTGHHAHFYHGNDKTHFDLSVENSIDLWIKHGVPAEKIRLGIASYGRTFNLLSSSSHGIGSPVNGPGKPGERSQEGGFLAYNEICRYVNTDDWTVDEDDLAGTFAYSNSTDWCGYDTMSQVVRKVRHAVDQGCGGILFKDLGSDDFEGICHYVSFPLLRAIKNELTQAVQILNSQECLTKQ